MTYKDGNAIMRGNRVIFSFEEVPSILMNHVTGTYIGVMSHSNWYMYNLPWVDYGREAFDSIVINLKPNIDPVIAE